MEKTKPIPVRRITLYEDFYKDILKDAIIKKGKNKLSVILEFPHKNIIDLIFLEFIDYSKDNFINRKSLFLLCSREWLKRNDMNKWNEINGRNPDEVMTKEELNSLFQYFDKKYKETILKVLGLTASHYSYKKIIGTIEEFVKKTRNEGTITDTNGCDDSNIFYLEPTTINLYNKIEIFYDVIRKSKEYISYDDLEEKLPL
jgi:hypothetical protein